MWFDLSTIYIKQFVVVAYTLQNAVEMVTISISYEYLAEAVARYELDNLLYPMGIEFVENIVVLFLESIKTNRRRELTLQSTRTINPKLGFLGLLGFAGFLGFWTYSVDKTIFPFVFFLFFGFFGFFYEGKMSNTLLDERFKENKMKAQSVANKTSLTIIFLAILILGQGKLMDNLEYTLIALVIVIALSIALEIFLGEYLLYHYDNDEQFDESEE